MLVGTIAYTRTATKPPYLLTVIKKKVYFLSLLSIETFFINIFRLCFSCPLHKYENIRQLLVLGGNLYKKFSLTKKQQEQGKLLLGVSNFKKNTPRKCYFRDNLANSKTLWRQIF